MLIFVQKHTIRSRICTAMVELKEGQGDPHNDLDFWKWAMDVISRLGAEGMSSDESCDEDSRTHERIYKVSISVWCKHMEDVLKIVDDCRHDQNGVFLSVDPQECGEFGHLLMNQQRGQEASAHPWNGYPTSFMTRTGLLKLTGMCEWQPCTLTTKSSAGPSCIVVFKDLGAFAQRPGQTPVGS